MELYSVRSVDVGHRVVKFDDDFAILSINIVFPSIQPKVGRCTCPRGAFPVCRHRTIVATFLEQGKVDTGWFLDYTDGHWERPLNDPVRIFARKKERAREEQNR